LLDQLYYSVTVSLHDSECRRSANAVGYITACVTDSGSPGSPLLRENLADTDTSLLKTPISNQHALITPQPVAYLRPLPPRDPEKMPLTPI